MNRIEVITSVERRSKKDSETGAAFVDLPQIRLALSAPMPRFASANPQALGGLDWRNLTPIRRLKDGKGRRQNQLPKVVSGVILHDGIEVASEKKFAA